MFAPQALVRRVLAVHAREQLVHGRERSLTLFGRRLGQELEHLLHVMAHEIEVAHVDGARVGGGGVAAVERAPQPLVIFEHEPQVFHGAARVLLHRQAVAREHRLHRHAREQRHLLRARQPLGERGLGSGLVGEHTPHHAREALRPRWAVTPAAKSLRRTLTSSAPGWAESKLAQVSCTGTEP